MEGALVPHRRAFKNLSKKKQREQRSLDRLFGRQIKGYADRPASNAQQHLPIMAAIRCKQVPATSMQFPVLLS
eukprot:14905138-Alexandrium_andersonii.AAC.1